MATRDDVRKIALSMPAVEKIPERFAFAVRRKGKLKEFAWVWMERIDPKKPRVPNPGVLAVRVASAAEKERILASDAVTFFTEPHYQGFPAVLVRLNEIRVPQLRKLLTEAWRCQAPVDLTIGSARRR